MIEQNHLTLRDFEIIRDKKIEMAEAIEIDNEENNISKNNLILRYRSLGSYILYDSKDSIGDAVVLFVIGFFYAFLGSSNPVFSVLCGLIIVIVGFPTNYVFKKTILWLCGCFK